MSRTANLRGRPVFGSCVSIADRKQGEQASRLVVPKLSQRAAAPHKGGPPMHPCPPLPGATFGHVLAPCRRRCRSRGFSLLELLVVIAIVLILATLAGVNSGGILGAAGVTSGAELVHNQINAARQNAASKGLTSFVVIRKTGANAWQRVGVFAQAPGETQWQQVDRWRNLPVQCFVDPDYSPSSEPWARKPLSLTEAHQKVPAPTVPIRDVGTALVHGNDYLAMAFLPDGSLVADDNVALRVAAGRSDNGNVSIQGGLAPVNWVKLVIEKISGQVKELSP